RPSGAGAAAPSPVLFTGGFTVPGGAAMPRTREAVPPRPGAGPLTSAGPAGTPRWIVPSPSGRAAPTTERRCARHGRRETAMAGVVWALTGVVAILAVAVAVGLVWGARSLQRLEARVGRPGAGVAIPIAEVRLDPEYQDEKKRQEHTLAGLRAAVDQASATVEKTRASLSAARTDAATAKAEAGAARAEGEARRERAPRQAEKEAEQVKAVARRSGEREIAVLTSAAREHAAEVERRARRLDERELRLAEEADRLAEREKQIRAVE